MAELPASTGPLRIYQLPDTPPVAIDDDVAIAHATRGTRRTSVAALVGGMTGSSVYYGRILVDGTNGDDATGQRNNLSKPFRTVGAAIAVALPYDLIQVNAGTYTVTNVSAQNVTITGNEGVIFECPAPLIDDTILDAPAIVAIRGYIQIKNTQTSNWKPLINLTIAGSRVTIECYEISGTSNNVNAILGSMSKGLLNIICESLRNNNLNGFNISGGKFQLSVDSVSQISRLLASSGTGTSTINFRLCTCRQLLDWTGGNGTINGALFTNSVIAPYDSFIKLNNPTLTDQFTVSIRKYTSIVDGLPAILHVIGKSILMNGVFYLTNNFSANQAIKIMGSTQQLALNNITIFTDSTYCLGDSTATIQNLGTLCSNKPVHVSLTLIPSTNVANIDALLEG